MSSHSLTSRLQALADTYKQTLGLIQELQNYSPSASTSSGDPDERRNELATEIHQSLRDQDDILELLRHEVDDDSGSQLRRYASNGEDERERSLATVSRLTEDLKSARAAFRRAQLQAKRNADNAKRKEREQLFSDRSADHAHARRKGQEKLTQDELALNAAQDVTRSLRRTHDLLSGNLKQSQFAQQTLEESQDALSGLSESYSGTGDLLKSSKGLVGQLLRSQKSDTWFLETSFYLLAATIAWLVFRRILYGPLWWFVWQPLRLMWWVTLTSLGSLGLGTAGEVAASSSVAISSTAGVPTNIPGMPARSVILPGKGGGQAQPAQPSHQDSTEDSMIEKIGRSMEEGPGADIYIDEIGDDQMAGADGQPRNPKKRMMEVDVEDLRARDEL